MITAKKYRSWLAEAKAYVLPGKLETALQVNRNLLILYRYVGNPIDAKIQQQGGGSKIIMVNTQLRQPGDNPSSGIILYSSKDAVEVDCALNNIAYPIGVSDCAFGQWVANNRRGKLAGAKLLRAAIKGFLTTKNKLVFNGGLCTTKWVGAKKIA